MRNPICRITSKWTPSLAWKVSLSIGLLGGVGTALAAPPETVPPTFSSVQVRTNGDVALRFTGSVGQRYRLEVSGDLGAWEPLVTVAGASAMDHVDGGTRGVSARYYRALALADSTALTGDHLATTNGEVVLHPINHASLVWRWNDLWVYVDPVGGAGPYAELPRADLILVTHGHGDHFHAATLEAVRKAGTTIVAPAAVYSIMSTGLRALTTPLANGESMEVSGLGIEAVPAYNANHPKGVGNGYVATVGGRRLYFSGDTEDVAEMRALTGIDVAFLCMNLPFTMSVERAASAVRAFRPRIVYPYHYRNQNGTLADLEDFRGRVGTEAAVEVRMRKWY